MYKRIPLVEEWEVSYIYWVHACKYVEGKKYHRKTYRVEGRELTGKQISKASHGIILANNELDPLCIKISMNRHNILTFTTHQSKSHNSSPKFTSFYTNLVKSLQYTYFSIQKYHFFTQS